MPHKQRRRPARAMSAMRIASARAAGDGLPIARIVAAAAPAIATTAPTEMSMPRVAITSVMPSATSTSGAARLRMSTALP